MVSEITINNEVSFNLYAIFISTLFFYLCGVVGVCLEVWCLFGGVIGVWRCGDTTCDNIDTWTIIRTSWL